MKKVSTAIMLVATALMISACGNKAGNGENQDSTKVAENANQEVTAEDEDDFEVPVRKIVSIRETWADKTIKVDADKSKVSIKDFALAFCKTYPQCETNEAMRRYLSDPELAAKDDYRLEIDNPKYDYPDAFYLSCNSKNGYIRCMQELQTDRYTFACYWNRTNGHKLFAAYMEECWEQLNWDQCLICFYDYDPATGVMIPEPALTKMIEERMKQYELCYYVMLPEVGKDIEVTGVDSMEEDACADENFILKWDGMTFKWEE